MQFLKVFGLWLGFLAVAIIGGAIREKFLIPPMGPLAGRALGTLLVSAVIFALIYVYVARLRGVNQGSLLSLGAFWTALTLAFECLFGHYVMGASWESLAADYNVFRGRLWPLVLLVTLFGPLWARKIRDYRVRQSA